MQVYVFAKSKQKEDSKYYDTYFSIRGVNLSGESIPIHVMYFGTRKPAEKADAASEKQSAEKADAAQEKQSPEEKTYDFDTTEPEPPTESDAAQEKKDANYGARMSVLQMFSCDAATGELANPVNLWAKKVKSGGNADGEVYYLECGRDMIPIEVVDFTTEERPDYRYRANCRKLKALTTIMQ